MAESFSRWESDPLFSAAEVVQDSADRMESVFRLLFHERSLVQGENLDERLLNSIQYHRRDLVTALETTKWQLEDFERAVYFAASSDTSGSRKNAISRHKQFISAIREQIVQVGKSLEDSSAGDVNNNLQLLNSSEIETDGLASFLYGADSMDHNVHYDSGSSIMRRFLDSATNDDEIVELKPDKIKHLQVDDMKHPGHDLDSQGNKQLRNSGFPYSGAYALELGEFNEKSSSNNRLTGSLWGFLSNFWFANKRGVARSFTKRRKDGELTDGLVLGFDTRPSSSMLKTTPTEQGLHFDRQSSAIQFYHWLAALQRIFQRFKYGIQYNHLPRGLPSAIVIALVLLGCQVQLNPRGKQ